jgi:hypothetical protein
MVDVVWWTGEKKVGVPALTHWEAVSGHDIDEERRVIVSGAFRMERARP